MGRAFIPQSTGCILFQMMGLYTLGLGCYRILLRLAALFVPKAQLLITGQRKSELKLKERKQVLHSSSQRIWMHCASLGEFEQGRPVLEKLKKDYPAVFIVLTFYSPSGFEIRKDTPLADLVLYLPPDYPSITRQWVKEIAPTVFISVKYEIWPNLFRSLKKEHVPILMLSAIFREDHRYFGMFSFFWKPILHCVSYFGVQNQTSLDRLTAMGVARAERIGDTRYDRVWSLAQQAKVAEEYVHWLLGRKALIIGSSYEREERVMWATRAHWQKDFVLIIAPHHIDERNVDRLKKMWGQEMVLATELKTSNSCGEGKSVLLLNTMGELGGLYSLGTLALVGGGWGKGIHNTLEPAAHGLAVIWGPEDQNFDEARGLIAAGGGARFQTEDDMSEWIIRHLEEAEYWKKMGQNARNHVIGSIGATDRFMEVLKSFLK
jgi:3-deoxy-D-manno-octulosonic-acid transferase